MNPIHKFEIAADQANKGLPDHANKCLPDDNIGAAAARTLPKLADKFASAADQANTCLPDDNIGAAERTSQKLADKFAAAADQANEGLPDDNIGAAAEHVWCCCRSSKQRFAKQL